MAKAKRFDAGGDIADVGKAMLGGFLINPIQKAFGIKDSELGAGAGGAGIGLLEKAMKDKEAERRLAMSTVSPSAATMMKKGGTASSRADGIASRGKTKGRFV
jgi:hypothetical protein